MLFCDWCVKANGGAFAKRVNEPGARSFRKLQIEGKNKGALGSDFETHCIGPHTQTHVRKLHIAFVFLKLKQESERFVEFTAILINILLLRAIITVKYIAFARKKVK